jgi:peptidoglycan/xylan/chitin deacetylase (PgdA/CDA1 family)
MRSGVRALGRLACPVARASRRLATRNGLTIIGWHRVDGNSRGLSTGVDAFRRHLDVLEAWGATVLPLDQAVRDLAAGALPDRAVSLTFDDGYASVVETAWPLLRERSLPATLFAVTGYLTADLRFAWDRDEPEHDRFRLATSDQLVAAADEGLDIGSHTVTHPWLPRLEQPRLETELAESRQTLGDLLGREITSVAYPTGGWDPRVRAAAERAGYGIGVTVDRGLNSARVPQLSLRRAFVPDDPRDLRLILDGAYTVLRPLDRWRSRGGPDW